MDESWIMMPRNSPVYEHGVRGFIDFAFKHHSVEGKIICHCSLCGFRKWQTREDVYDHLICKQFPRGYTFWHYHGEANLGETSNAVGRDISNVEQDVTVNEDPT